MTTSGLSIFLGSPRQGFSHDGVVSAELVGADGHFSVRPRHAGVIARLAAGVTSVRTAGQTHYYYTGGGTAWVEPTHCQILVGEVQRVDALDPRVIQREIHRYHDDLAGLEFEEERRLMAREIAIAERKLEIARRWGKAEKRSEHDV